MHREHLGKWTIKGLKRKVVGTESHSQRIIRRWTSGTEFPAEIKALIRRYQ